MNEVTHIVDESDVTGKGTAHGRFRVKFLFYDSPSFSHPVTNLPYFMNLNQDVYLKATLYSINPRWVLFTDTCIASANPHDFVNGAYYIIKNG